MKRFFSSEPLWQSSGIAVVRIIVGLFMVFHGIEVFDSEVMKGYTKWDTFKGYSSPAFLVYMGKSAELVAGIFLTIGLFTRLASIILICTMLYIAFFVGHGKVWYDDQHPFLFVLLGLVFIFCGPGKLSVDYILSNKKSSYSY